MRASRDDFEDLGVLAGLEKHWRLEDDDDVLSVARAQYWWDVLVPLHIPQLVLLRQIEGVYPEGALNFRRLVRDLLNARAMLLLAFDHAVIHNQPIDWSKQND